MALALRVGPELQPHARQHAQKRTVHEQAIGQIEHERIEASLGEAVDQRLEIEAGPARNLDAGRMISHPNRQTRRGRFHSFIATSARPEQSVLGLSLWTWLVIASNNQIG